MASDCSSRIFRTMKLILRGFLGICLCLQVLAHAQQALDIKGRLLDPKGQPVAFVALEFKGRGYNHALITDFEGAFRLKLPEDQKILVFLKDPRFSGILAKIKTDSLSSEIRLQLTKKQSEALSWPEIQANDKPELFAIREAIRRRIWNLTAPGNYQSRAETILRVGVPSAKPYPRFWLWEVIPDSSETGTNYLSQSISSLYFGHQPRGFLEQIEGYRYRGLEQSFSRQARAWHQFSLYDSRSALPGFSDIPYQSPVGWGAMVNYNYRLIGYFYRNGRRMVHLAVEPKNPFQPLWTGTLVLEEGSWQITRAELKALKSTGLYRVDSLSLRMESSLTDLGWLPSSLEIQAWKKAYGAVLQYDIQASYHNYKTMDSIPKGMARKGYRLPEQALNYDEAYWEHFTCLSPEENASLCAEDSLLNLPYTSREIYDSLSRTRNRPIRWYAAIIGHTFQNRKKRSSLYFDGLLNDKLEYNTVEGFVMKQSVKYTKSWPSLWHMEVEPILRYGFSDQRLKGRLSTRLWSESSLQSFDLEGGSYMFQINNSEPINSIINTFYSLFFRQNFMKLYRKEYVKFNYEREVINGLYLSAGMEWAKRTTVENTADFSFFSLGNGFTPNNPNSTLSADHRLYGHQGTWFRLGLTLKPGQQFLRHLGNKEVLESDYPVFSLFLHSGVPGILGSKVDYNLLELSASDRVSFGAVGETSFILRTGIFINAREMTYLDFVHFLGEQTYFLGSAANATYLDQFRALDYYRYSTRNSYVEGHYQHDFHGFLLNRIPGIKHLKWNYYGGVNFLVMFNQSVTPYTEVYLGFDNLLGAIPSLEWFNFRFDVAMQVNQTGVLSPTLLVGLGTRFNELLR